MSSSSSITVHADYNGQVATFDFAASPAANADLTEELWTQLHHCYATLPPPDSKDGVSVLRLTWVDSDGDEVELDNSADAREALQYASTRTPAVLELFVRPASSMGDSQCESVSGVATPKQQPQRASSQNIEEVDAGAPIIGDSPQPLIEEPDANKAQPLTIEEYNAPVDVASPTEAPAADAQPVAESASASAAAPAASPSSWSLFGIFGRSAPASTGAEAPIAEPVVNETPLSQVDSSQSSSFSVDSSLSASAQLKAAADHDFQELDEGGAAEMEAAGAGLRGHNSAALWDSSEVTQDVLSRVFTSMLSRTEERLGLDAAVSSSGHDASVTFVRQPHQALLAQLRGLDARAFDGIVNQFVEICTAHVDRVQRETEAAEKVKLEKMVEEMRLAAEEERARMECEEKERRQREELMMREAEAVKREEEARARAEAAAKAEEARAKAEAERQSLLKAARENEEALRAKRDAAREAEQRELEAMAVKMAELKAAHAQAEKDAEEAARIQKDLEALPLVVPEILQPQPIPAAVVAPVDIDQPLLQAPVVDRAASPSPLIVPHVAVPVASPLSPVQLSAAEKFNRAMSELRDMGFLDDSLNTYMLQKTNLDIAQTIDWLMADAASGGDLKESVKEAMRR